ncbi:unnamed protein product [Rotaria magnacalcarata]|uniref:FLYWCH-type domain-containing protein n=1 Tax=Rotaria magnacalcarata TaxID=392030 RepID=A0A816USI5_9BILA|nr:unnamed protein product [Rotaria magnacalcarata]
MTSHLNTISFLVSQKGKPVSVKDNFIYKLNKTTNSTKYYRCAEQSCTVTLHTDLNDVLVKVKGDHSHPPEPDEIEIRKFKQNLKQRAIQETVPIPKIYDEESSRFCLTSLSIAILPAQREIAGSLNKSRRLQTPVIPDSQTFDIPEVYSKTLKNEPFLCIDKFIRRKTRVLVFASREQLTLLFESSIIFMDGTFSASPSIFDQVYSLHGIKYQQCFHNRLNARLSKSHPNIWTFIKCIQGEQNRFNHLMIQMKGGLSSRQKTARTLAIQQRLNTLYLRHEKGDTSDSELFEGLSYVVAKNMVSKKNRF